MPSYIALDRLSLLLRMDIIKLETERKIKDTIRLFNHLNLLDFYLMCFVSFFSYFIHYMCVTKERGGNMSLKVSSFCIDFDIFKWKRRSINGNDDRMCI